MASDAKVDFKWNETTLARIRKNIATALLSLGMDTANQAQRKAPVDTGALVNSIRMSKTSDNEVVVLAGGTASGYNVPYARFREYNNNLHPNTRFYMKNALEWANKNVNKYFKGITK